MVLAIRRFAPDARGEGTQGKHGNFDFVCFGPFHAKKNSRLYAASRAESCDIICDVLIGACTGAAWSNKIIIK